MVNIENAEFGGFWRRFFAYLIDGIILTVALFAIAFVLESAGIKVLPKAPTPTMSNTDSNENVTGIANTAEQTGGEGEIIFNIINIIIGLGYFVYFHSSAMQATPGKKLLGVYVVDKNGNRISTARAVGRYFATILSWIIAGIGYLMVAFTKRKTGLHDIIAGTYVVKGKPE